MAAPSADRTRSGRWRTAPPAGRWPHVKRTSTLAPGRSAVTAPDAPAPGGLAAPTRPVRSGATGVIAVAGEALVDLVPAPVGEYFEIAPGGSPANVALGLARLGVPARLLARISDDLLGRRIRAHLTHNGVQLDHAVAAKEQTSLGDGVAGRERVAGLRLPHRRHGRLAVDARRGRGRARRGAAGPVVALHSGSLALTTAPGDAVLRDLLMRASDTITISYDPNCRPMLMGNPEGGPARRARDARGWRTSSRSARKTSIGCSRT